MASRGFPSMTALLGLLAIAGYQNRDKIAEMIKDFSNKNQAGGAAGSGAQQGELGGLEDWAACSAAPASAGSSMAASTNCSSNSTQNGQKETVDSWVGKGPNRDIAPPDLKQALGPEVLQTLARATGMSEQDLLARLSKELPNAVDKYTPEGRIAA